jgi:2-methylisocitrate lyase-like PEP mutase family enzyme
VTANLPGSPGAGPTGAERLRAMHHGPQLLVLPNAWDPVSARAYAGAGFEALATSSAAVALTIGYADGQTPGAAMLEAVARIAASVEVPVTADLEAGYGLPPAELVDRLLAAGVVGCNLEDSDPATRELGDPARQADFLAAVRAAAGPALVINARVDVFVRPGPRDDGSAVSAAVQRANAYLAAGADCAYPIIAPPEALPALVREINGPVNAMHRPGGPTLAELAAIGVARVSFGSTLHAQIAERIRENATSLAAERDGLR